MAQPLSETFKKIELALNGLLPLMQADDKVSPEAYYAAQHARDWIELCLNELTTVPWDTTCPFCKHEFKLAESPIACPACSHAVDNWVGDEELEEALDAQLQGLSREQKLFLITSIAGDLCAQEDGEEDSLKKPDFTDTVARIYQELTADQKESLLVALIHQVNGQRPAHEVRENPEISLTEILEIID